jgi:AcrR family transcriptional regulator
MEHTPDTKERISAAAGELFLRYGIKSVTMDDIAKQLGMSKKTLYQFYGDKDEIVIHLMERDLSKYQKEFEVVRANAKDAISEILALMKHLGEMFGKINPIVFYEMQKFHPNAWTKFNEFKEKCAIRMIEENIRVGKEQGLYRKNIDAKIMSWYRMEQVEWAMKPNPLTSTSSMAELQVALLDHFLHGICTLKGHKLINKYYQINEEE